MKIKKGDNIIVLSGKDRGKEGVVIRTFPKKEEVLVEGVHVVKRHQRSNRRGQAGQIVERPMPVHVSNVALKDTKTGKPTRVGYVREEGKKVRIAQKSGEKV